MGCIYVITNLLNGKEYVGCTKKAVSERWIQHLSAARKGSRCAVHCAIRKYGETCFKIVVIEEVRGSHSDLMQAEIRIIQVRGSRVPRGYNQAHGGQGVDHSDTTIGERIGATHRKRLAEDPRRLENRCRAARLRYQDPEYAERHAAMLKARAKDPEWLRKNAEANARKPLDPAWRIAHSAGVSKRTSDPRWRRNTSNANRLKVRDPRWVEANRIGHVKRCLIQVEKDASLDPLELQRRLKNRAKTKRAKEKRLMNGLVT